MLESTYLTNHFLVAMPAIANKQLQHTVILLCQHCELGATGIIVNRPYSIAWNKLLGDMDIDLTQTDEIEWPELLDGGETRHEYGFVIHSPDKTWESTLFITEDLAITRSLDAIKSIVENTGPKYASLAFGFTSWEPGQLEKELVSNYWLHLPPDTELLFETPVKDRWEKATEKLGSMPHQISEDIGHA